jgi:hypothetical protein
MPSAPDMKEEFKAMSYVWGQGFKLFLDSAQQLAHEHFQVDMTSKCICRRDTPYLCTG